WAQIKIPAGVTSNKRYISSTDAPCASRWTLSGTPYFAEKAHRRCMSGEFTGYRCARNVGGWEFTLFGYSSPMPSGRQSRFQVTQIRGHPSAGVSPRRFLVLSDDVRYLPETGKRD